MTNITHKRNYDIEPPERIEALIGEQVEALRLSRNCNQSWLAAEAGVSRRTISRLENGEGVSLDTLIRVMQALNVADRFSLLFPDASVSPIDRVRTHGRKRQRARMTKKDSNTGFDDWTWGDDS